MAIVSRGHALFRKRGKGSGNFFYSSLFYRSVQCGTDHSAVFCHMSAAITTLIGNSYSTGPGIYGSIQTECKDVA